MIMIIITIMMIMIKSTNDDNGDGFYDDGDDIHAKSGRYLRYISAIFFGFSAKF